MYASKGVCIQSESKTYWLLGLKRWCSLKLNADDYLCEHTWSAPIGGRPGTQQLSSLSLDVLVVQRHSFRASEDTNFYLCMLFWCDPEQIIRPIVIPVICDVMNFEL